MRLANVSLSNFDGPSFDALVGNVAAAEASGFDIVWVSDPSASSSEMLEPYALLGALAVRTSSVHLGVLATPVGSRNPAVLAKQATAVDVLTNGRAILGMALPEGGPVGLEQLEEALEIANGMFSGNPCTFEGTYFHTASASDRPAPRTSGGPPIVIGECLASDDLGVSKLVARHADAWTLSPDRFTDQSSLLEQQCKQLGRELSTVSRLIVIDATTSSFRDDLGDCLASGVDSIVVDVPVDVDHEGVSEIAEAFGQLNVDPGTK